MGIHDISIAARASAIEKVSRVVLWISCRCGVAPATVMTLRRLSSPWGVGPVAVLAGRPKRDAEARLEEAVTSDLSAPVGRLQAEHGATQHDQEARGAKRSSQD